MTVFTWSTTAATNDDVDSSINWQEGQAPSSVNNSARAMMAAIAKWRDDMSGNLVTAGTSTAYTLTTNQTFTALTDGITVTCRMSATSGATPTLNVDGLGAKSIAEVYGTALDTGALLSGGVYTFTYDSTDDKWIVHNAERILTAANIANTAAGTIAATDVQTALNELDTDKVATTVTLTAAGLVTGGGTLAANRTFTVTAAVQADQETGSSTSVAVVPGVMKYFPGVLKAFWDVDQSSGTAAIQASSGVSSVTDSTVGQFDINLSTAMSSINYAITVGSTNSVPGAPILVNIEPAPTASLIPVRTFGTSFNETDSTGQYGMVAGDV